MAQEFELDEALSLLDTIIGEMNRPASHRPDQRPFAVIRTYDETSDTFLIHFYGRGIRTYSAPVHSGDHDPFMFLIDRDSDDIVGIHFENFIHGFVQHTPSAAKMLAGAEWRPATPRHSARLGSKPEQASLDRVVDSFVSVAG